MRPRHKAAENGDVLWLRELVVMGFNEAAA